MADVKFEVTSFDLRTSAGTQDVTISGFGTPKAAIFIMSNGITDDTPVGTNGVISIGFTDGVRECAMAFREVDGAATSDTSRAQRNNAVVVFPGNSGTSATSAHYSFDSWVTDGVRINADDALGNSRIVTCILIGGADVTAHVNIKDDLGTGTSAVAVTEPGFEPDLVFMTCVGSPTINLNSAQTIFSFGAAHNGASIAQAAAFVDSRDNATTMNLSSQISNTDITGQQTNGVLSWGGELTAFTASGFEITPSSSAGSDIIGYLALGFANGPDVALFDMSWPTSGDYADTTPGFEPNFGFICSLQTPSSRNTVTNDDYGLSLMAFDAANVRTTTATSEDGVTVSSADNLASDQARILNVGGASDSVLASSYAFDADGWDFTLTTNPASALLGFGVAVGEGGGGSPITVVLGQATETSTAQPITSNVSTVVAIGQVSETDTAQTITADYIDELATNGFSQPIHANNNPTVICHEGKTTIVYQGPTSLVNVVQYDHNTGAVSSPVVVSTLDNDGALDDHSAPAIVRRPSDGKFHVLHGDHATNIEHAVSDSADDITAWTDLPSPSTASTGSPSTYPHTCWIGGTLYWFYRAGDSTNRPLAYRKWDGTTWSDEVELYAPSGWVYPTDIVARGQYIYVAFNRRPNGSGAQHTSAMLRMNTANSDALESVFGAALTTPVTAGEFTTDVQIEASSSAGSTPTVFTTRVGFDENGGVHAAYNILIGSTETLRYADGSGGSWSFTSVTTTVDSSSSPCELIVNAADDIDIFVQRSNGDIDRWNSSPSWSNDETIATTGLARFMRRVDSGLANLKLIIVEEDNEDFANADLNIFGWGDSGLTTTNGSQAVVTSSIGVVAETDSAQSITLGGSVSVPLGQATETDTAQTVTPNTGNTVVLGQAAETDTAFAIDPLTSQIVVVGQPVETDTAQSITAALSPQVELGQASETDTAFGITPVVPITVTLGQATETDTAFSVSVAQGLFRQLGLAETNAFAFSITPQVDTWGPAPGPTGSWTDTSASSGVWTDV